MLKRKRTPESVTTRSATLINGIINMSNPPEMDDFFWGWLDRKSHIRLALTHKYALCSSGLRTRKPGRWKKKAWYVSGDLSTPAYIEPLAFFARMGYAIHEATILNVSGIDECEFIRKLTCLTKLDMGTTIMNDSLLAAVATLPNLTSLNIRIQTNDNLTSSGFVNLSLLTRLTSLDVFSNHSTPNGWLVYIAKLEHLRHLTLTGASSDKWFSHLKNLQLTSLSILAVDVMNGGLDYLVDMPLTSLELQGFSHITDSSLSCISKMKLTWLNLIGCRHLTDACVQHLLDMPLRMLNIRHTLINRASVDVLKIGSVRV
jgi:hypothetical protein